MPKVRASAALRAARSPRPRLKDVIRELMRIKRTSYKTRSAFYARWAEARREVYRTKEWQEFKLRIQARSRGRCESCRRRPAEQIHHRKRVYERPDLIVEASNVLHICVPCHEVAHGRTCEVQ